MLLFLLVFFPLFWGMLLFRQRDEKKLWYGSLLAAVSMLLLSIVALCQGQGSVLILPLFHHMGIGFESNNFSLLYAVLICALFLVAVISSREYFAEHPQRLYRYYTAIFLTLSGCMGVFFAYDLFTLFVFFELMSFSSYLWVLHNQNKDAISASNIYLVFTVVGGMSVLFGIFALTAVTGDLTIANLPQAFANPTVAQRAIPACLFLFFGFGAKAGVFLVHDWLPLAHTASPAPVSGLLSGVLTKCGIYGILMVAMKIMVEIQGFSIFILIMSLFNMLVGAVCAFQSGNLKRTLAFSTISQIGFILWGIAFWSLLGSHNAIAAYGTLFHMINHSVLKVLFFTMAGIVYAKAHSLELEELRGFGRGKTWLQGLFGFSVLSMSGVPFFCVYVSKTLLHEAVVEYLHFHPEASNLFQVSEWIFLVSGGFTVAYMLKLYCCLFIEKSETPWDTGDYATKPTLTALSVLCVFLFLLGAFPHSTFDSLGHYTAEFFSVHHLEEIQYFSFTNLQGTLISLTIGCGIFFQNKLSAKNSEKLEYREKLKPENNFIEKLYIPILRAVELVCAVIMRCFDLFLETIATFSSQRYFKSLIIPETFYFGEEFQEKRKPLEVKVTQSLAYSLLMFGLGFIFTIVYLLLVGGSLS